MMPLSLPSQAPLSARAPRSTAAADPAPAVLGALVTGALAPRDVATLPPEAWPGPALRMAYEALLVAPAPRGEPPAISAVVATLGTRAIPRPGSRFVLIVGPVFWRALLVDLARRAPRRREALAAVEQLRAAWHRREDIACDREALLEVLGEVVDGAARAWLRQVTADGGITYQGAEVRRIEAGSEVWEGRYPVRPVEPEAMPRPGALAAMLAAAMARRAEAERLRVAGRREAEAGEWREIEARALPTR